MKNGKIKGFLKTKVGTCITTGFICFILGGSFMSDSTRVTELENILNDKEQEISVKDNEISTLSAKVNEAEPYFAMQEEEKAQLEAQAQKEKEEREAQEKAEAEAKAQAEIEAKTIQLSSGNYEAGVDFEAGTYNIVAIDGSGNVYSSNMYSGGLNAVMASEAKIAELSQLGMGDLYKTEYKNIKLKQGTTLTTDGVTIKLIPSK